MTISGDPDTGAKIFLYKSVFLPESRKIESLKKIRGVD